MRLFFASGRTKLFKVGEPIPFGDPIVRVVWSIADIAPGRDKFLAYMQETIYPAFLTQEVVNTAEVDSATMEKVKKAIKAGHPLTKY